DVQFLTAFPAQCVMLGLAVLDPPAGQFPQSGGLVGIGPLLDEQLAAVDDRRRHDHTFHGSGHDRRSCLRQLTSKRAPPSGDSPTTTRPPRRRIASATNASPSPVPPELRARSSEAR